jgi:hypothetical protein
MDNSRGVVSRVLPIDGGEHGFAEIPFGIRAADAFIHRFRHQSVYDMHILADFKVHHGHAGVLAGRDPFVFGNFIVVYELAEDLPAAGGGFLVFGLTKRDGNIFARRDAGRKEGTANGGGYVFCVYDLHSRTSTIKGFSMLNYSGCMARMQTYIEKIRFWG